MTRFTPGMSGNPTGKRRGTSNKLTSEARRILEAQTPAVLHAAVDAALAGDTTAMRVILTLALPRRVRPTLDLPPLTTPTGVADALTLLANYAAQGAIEADEARALAAVVEAAGRQIDANRQMANVFEVLLAEISAEKPEVAQRITRRLASLDLAVLPPASSLNFVGDPT